MKSYYPKAKQFKSTLKSYYPNNKSCIIPLYGSFYTRCYVRLSHIILFWEPTMSTFIIKRAINLKPLCWPENWINPNQDWFPLSNKAAACQSGVMFREIWRRQSTPFSAHTSPSPSFKGPSKTLPKGPGFYCLLMIFIAYSHPDPLLCVHGNLAKRMKWFGKWFVPRFSTRKLKV